MITNWQYHPSKDEKLLFTLLLFLVVIILLSFATSNRVGNKWKICTAVKIGMVGISYGMKRILREMGGGRKKERERGGKSEYNVFSFNTDAMREAVFSNSYCLFTILLLWYHFGSFFPPFLSLLLPHSSFVFLCWCIFDSSWFRNQTFNIDDEENGIKHEQAHWFVCVCV